MDNVTPSQNSPVVIKEGSPLTSFVFLILGIIIGVLGLFVYQTYYKDLLPMSQPIVTPAPTQMVTPSPITTPIASPTADMTANWKTYTSTTQNITFKYPSEWTLTVTPGDKMNGSMINEIITLKKEQAVIGMNMNMYGIGGVGQTYTGTPMMLDTLSLYEYSVQMSATKKHIIGLTDTLTQSLGLFQNKGKTYSITLTYPDSYDQSAKGSDYQKEFDQIISTFKFL